MKKIQLLLMLWAVCLPLWTTAQSNAVHLSEVTVNVEKPGTLGDLILQQTENLTDVVTLHLSGQINAADLLTLQKRLSRMRNLDAMKLQLTEIPERFLYNNDTLRTVILPTVAKTVSKEAFYSCDSLKSVVLPEGLTTIGDRSFYYCLRLQNLTLPSTLKSIGESAFGVNRSLTEILLPDGLESLGKSAFSECSSLREVHIPASIKIIPEGAFSSTYELESLTIPEGITEIGGSAFYKAFWYDKNRSSHKQIRLTMPSTLNYIEREAFSSNPNIVELTLNEGLEHLGANCFEYAGIKEVTIPRTVNYARAAFYSCDSLKRITCLPLVPPANQNYNLVKGFYIEQEVKGCTLAVPAATISEYQQTVGYDHYAAYEALDYISTDITINRPFHLTVPANAPQLNITMQRDNYAGNFNLNGMGSLYVDGSNTLNVGWLSLFYDFIGRDYQYKYGNATSTYDPWGTNSDYNLLGKYGYTSIIANAPWTVGQVEQTIILPNDHWYFFSPLFDVKVGDIQYLNEYGAQLMICEYDSEQRAAANTANTWHQLSAGNTLQAGHGYILQGKGFVTAAGGYVDTNDKGLRLLFPLKKDGDKGTLCTTDDVTIPLTDYPSEFGHNRGWNFISNPYPCYVNGAQVDFFPPITVWDSYHQSYQAIRLMDDAYVFSPLEAFFVQYNAEYTEVVFHKEGRQAGIAIEKEEQQAPRRAAALANRKVFNVYLRNGDDCDRTRFVINSEAKADYEADKDAAYMPSLSDQFSALYTRQNGVHYAINERPVGDGLINLGMRLATDGTYTLSLNTNETDEVRLIDRQANTTVPLTAEGYTFTAEAGTIEGRFAIQLSGMTGIKNENVNKNDNAIYDLQGRRIECSMFNVQCSMLKKGIYIIGGKKHVVK